MNMRIIRTVLFLAVASLFFLNLNGICLAKNKFEKEVEKEQGAVKLVKEVQRGGYDVISTEGLKNLIDSKKDKLLSMAINSAVSSSFFNKINVFLL